MLCCHLLQLFIHPLQILSHIFSFTACHDSLHTTTAVGFVYVLRCCRNHACCCATPAGCQGGHLFAWCLHADELGLLDRSQFCCWGMVLHTMASADITIVVALLGCKDGRSRAMEKRLGNHPSLVQKYSNTHTHAFRPHCFLCGSQCFACKDSLGIVAVLPPSSPDKMALSTLSQSKPVRCAVANHRSLAVTPALRWPDHTLGRQWLCGRGVAAKTATTSVRSGVLCGREGTTRAEFA